MEMLIDIVGTMAAFSAIMFLLSLVVSALAQATQSLLNLRGKNLQFALERLFLFAQGESAEDHSRELAKKVMDEASMPRASGVGRLAGRTRVTWITLDELEKHVASKGLLDGDAWSTITAHFKAVEDLMSKRFGRIMRYVVFAWSLLVAIYFQIDTPQMISELSRNSEYRDQIIAMSTDALDGDTELQARYQDVSDEALAELTAKHPELAETLEEASGLGASRAQILGELQLVLEGKVEDSKQILGEYQELLDDAFGERFGKSLEQLRQANSALAELDIVPWQNGWSFYGKFRNCLGVFVTFILISLGAPFWKDNFSNMLRLGDTLKALKKSRPV